MAKMSKPFRGPNPDTPDRMFYKAVALISHFVICVKKHMFGKGRALKKNLEDDWTEVVSGQRDLFPTN